MDWKGEVDCLVNCQVKAMSWDPKREVHIEVENLLTVKAKICTISGYCLAKVVPTPLGFRPNFAMAERILIKVERNDCDCVGVKCLALYPNDMIVHEHFWSGLNVPGNVTQMKSFKKKVEMYDDEVISFGRSLPFGATNGVGRATYWLIGSATRVEGDRGCYKCRKIMLPRSQSIVVPWPVPQPVRPIVVGEVEGTVLENFIS